MSGSNFKSGFIALIGRPNAGKSTLLNAIMGEKLAITANIPQTTRRRLRAIRTTERSQMVFVDTPGLHRPKDALGSELNKSALFAMKDSDLILFLIDASEPVGAGDLWVAERIAETGRPAILVISKIDLVDQGRVEKTIADVREVLDIRAAVALSAKEGFNIEGLLVEIEGLLPEGPRWYDSETDTDTRLENLVAEFIREKAMRSTREEIPYSVEVTVQELDYDEERDLTSIRATLHVERESQKGILIGSGGKMIRTIGSQARRDLEELIGTKVFLDLSVQVLKDWRRDEDQLERLGYGE